MLWMAVLGAILLWFEVTNSKGSSHKTHAFQISPKPCWVDGYEGTCMFVWECIKSEGYHIGMCVDTFMFGSCCASNATSDALLPHYAIAAATGQPGNPAILYTSPIMSTSSGGGKPKPTSRPHATKLRPVTPLAHRPSHTVATSLTVKQSYRPMMSTDSFAAANNLPGWQTTTEPAFITNHQSEHSHHQSSLKPLQSGLKPLWHVTTEPGFVTRVKAKPGGFKQKPVGGPKPTKKPVGEKKTMKPLVETKRPPAAVNSVDNERMPQQNPQPLPELIPTSTVKSSVTVSTMANTDCGIPQIFTKPQMRIVGGKIAPFGRWPWQVSVRRTSFFGFSSTHRCGGAVLNENWIATAGHCVDDLLTSQIRIRVGEHDFSSVQEQYPYVERAVSRKIVHPKYNFYTYEYDLALVQLEKPLEFAPHILPVCLPASDDLLIGENATVTGWGRLSEGGTLPSILQEVQVPIVSNERCKSMFLKAGRHEFIPEIFLCAGYDIGGQDSCQGDSGGPLQVKGKDGRYFLAGIISWGIGCAEANLPGVCTRISKFVPWILKNVT